VKHDLFQKATACTKSNTSGLHILVVNNHLATAESTATWLRSFGHQVQVASDVQSALQTAQSKPPDVVLLELALTDHDGWEVAERLQEPSWEKKPLLIALTNYASEADYCRSRQAGIDLHLVKPVAPDFLRRILERFCRIIMPSEGSSV
jgi:CheY-like chemotaxis protein